MSWCRLNTHQAGIVPDPGSTRIRDEQLYRQEGFKSFEAYCRQRLDIGRAHAYRLVDAAAVAETVSHGRQNLPPITIERHARELAKLPEPDQQAKALHLAKHPETAKGTAGGKKGGRGRPQIASARSAVANPVPSFVSATAAKTGKSERTIEPIPPRQRPQDRVPSSGWRDAGWHAPRSHGPALARAERPLPSGLPASMLSLESATRRR